MNSILSWQELLKRQKLERKIYIQNLNEQNLTLQEASQIAGISYRGFHNNIMRNEILWKNKRAYFN